MTDREGAVRRLCQLVTRVGEHFDHELEHACFCGETAAPSPRVNDGLLDFIEAAVDLAIEEA